MHVSQCLQAPTIGGVFKLMPEESTQLSDDSIRCKHVGVGVAQDMEPMVGHS